MPSAAGRPSVTAGHLTGREAESDAAGFRRRLGFIIFCRDALAFLRCARRDTRAGIVHNRTIVLFSIPACPTPFKNRCAKAS